MELRQVGLIWAGIREHLAFYVSQAHNWPSSSTQEIYPENVINAGENISFLMFIIVFFIPANNLWKTSKCITVKNWLNKWSQIYIIEFSLSFKNIVRWTFFI